MHPLLLAFAPWFAAPQSPPVEPEPSSADYVLIAVQRDHAAGRRQLAGVQRAYDELVGELGEDPWVTLETLHYDSERNGVEALFERMRAAAETEATYVVIGPSDSGVFTEVRNQTRAVDNIDIPVVSPVVTSQLPLSADGWYFRANVGIDGRTSAISDFLRRYWVRRIAVLYQDSEFGREAEHAFRQQLDARQVGSYQALAYDRLNGMRSGLQDIMTRQPEALGVFGERDDLPVVLRNLRSMNGGISPYSPLLFTVVDGRSLQGRVPDLYYVSVLPEAGPVEPPAEGDAVPVGAGQPVAGVQADEFEDEVEALGYDTTRIVLDALRYTRARHFEAKGLRREALRARIAFVLSSGGLPSVTRMHFKGLENQALPVVIHEREGHPPETIGVAPVSLPAKLRMKADLIWRGVGPSVFYVISFIFLITYLLSFFEIAQRYPKRKRQIVLRSYFNLMVAFHFTLAVLLYAVMAETGQVRYDSFSAAFLIAVTPGAFLRTTFFTTSAGRTIGLANVYDRVLSWFQGKIMIAAYKGRNRYENAIAYRNTVGGMKATLRDVYGLAKTTAQSDALIKELEDRTARAPDLLSERRILAHELLQTLSWSELVERDIAPHRYSGTFADPEYIIQAAAEYCLEDRARVDRLREHVDDLMGHADDSGERLVGGTSIGERFHEDLKRQRTLKGQVLVLLGHLWLHFSHDERELVKCGFLEDLQVVLEDAALRCTASLGAWHRLQVAAREIYEASPTDVQREHRKKLLRAATLREATVVQLSLLRRQSIFTRRRLANRRLCYSGADIISQCLTFLQRVPSDHERWRCLERFSRDLGYDPDGEPEREQVPVPEDAVAEPLPSEEQGEPVDVSAAGECATPKRKVALPVAPPEAVGSSPVHSVSDESLAAARAQLEFAIRLKGRGAQDLVDRGLFPDPEVVFVRAFKHCATRPECMERVSRAFDHLMRRLSLRERRYFRSRLKVGGTRLQRLRVDGWFLSNALGVQTRWLARSRRSDDWGPLSEFEEAQLDVMLRILLCNYGPDEDLLASKGLLPRDEVTGRATEDTGQLWPYHRTQSQGIALPVASRPAGQGRPGAGAGGAKQGTASKTVDTSSTAGGEA